MARYNISFDGEVMPSFMSVVSVTNSILPSITQNTTTIPYRIGEYCYGTEIGTRKIEVEVIIFADKAEKLPLYTREVARWLMHREPKKLVLGDMVGYYYNAIFTGDSALEELSKIGRATLTFMCYDPLLYGEESITSYPAGGSLNVENLGTAPTYPVVTMTAKRNLSEFNLVSGNEYVSVGKGMGVQDKPIDRDPYVLNERFVSLNKWTQAPSMVGDGVSIDMAKSDWEIYEGTSIRIAEKSWKDGVEWHGGGLESEWATPTQDFEFVAPVYFNANTHRSRGMIQTNIKDSSNRVISTVVYKRDTIDSETLKIIVKLHSTGGSSRVVFSQNLYSTNADFVGQVRIKRVGKKWSFSLERKYKNYVNDVSQSDWWKDGNGLSTYSSGVFYDNSSQYTSPIKKVQVGMFMWDKYEEGKESTENSEGVLPMLRCPMHIYNVFVKKLGGTQDHQDTDTDIIIYAGDVITVDCEEGAIYKNGSYFMNNLAPKSTFIKMDKSLNKLRLEPADAFQNVIVKVVPKWY